MREQAPVQTAFEGVPPPLPRPLTQGAGKRNERGGENYMTVSPPSFASTSESLTETIFETPFSSIVTPNKLSA